MTTYTKILLKTHQGVRAKTLAQFLGKWTPGPLPPCDPPPPHGKQLSPACLPKLNVCTDSKASCQVDLPRTSFNALFQDICDSFPMSRCFPAKNQMTCCPTIMDKSLTRMRLIHSQISQALPYSQILVKLCPVLVLPNKLV